MPRTASKDARIARQALHAWRLTFDHPVTRARLTLTAPVPADMQDLLKQVGWGG